MNPRITLQFDHTVATRTDRHIIRKAIGGYHEIDDDQLLTGLGQVDKQLRLLHAQLQQGLKEKTVRRIGGFLDIRPLACAYLEDLRQRCVDDLNYVLSGSGSLRYKRTFPPGHRRVTGNF